jgi:hypothetical protein
METGSWSSRPLPGGTRRPAVHPGLWLARKCPTHRNPEPPGGRWAPADGHQLDGIAWRPTCGGLNRRDRAEPYGGITGRPRTRRSGWTSLGNGSQRQLLPRPRWRRIRRPPQLFTVTLIPGPRSGIAASCDRAGPGPGGAARFSRGRGQLTAVRAERDRTCCQAASATPVPPDGQLRARPEPRDPVKRSASRCTGEAAWPAARGRTRAVRPAACGRDAVPGKAGGRGGSEGGWPEPSRPSSGAAR